MSYYVFKLNIEPAIMNLEKENDNWENFKVESIPNSLKEIFFSVEEHGYIKIERTRIDYSELRSELDVLQVDTLKLQNKYNEVMEHYLKNGEIHYGKEFLELNDICGENRRKLEAKYPILKQSHKKYSDNFIHEKYNLNLNTSVGTGIVHFNKFYKNLYYFEEYIENETESKSEEIAYYDKISEYIYIADDNESSAKDFSKYIESNINESGKIGMVKINPIYEKIEVTEPVKYIQYTVTYPNGNTPSEIDEILKKSGANSKTVKFEANSSENWNPDPVISDINNEGSKGYLEEIILSKTRKVKEYIKTEFKLPRKE